MHKLPTYSNSEVPVQAPLSAHHQVWLELHHLAADVMSRYPFAATDSVRLRAVRLTSTSSADINMLHPT